MKPVFKCDYCDFMDTEDKVKEHEENCIWNYDKRSCRTCHYAKMHGLKGYQCEQGKDILVGTLYEYCDKYERSNISKANDHHHIDGIFGSWFKNII